ncbi:MAG: hypothetical protein Q7T82_01240 [Armatimonadota bacterium]|nr:hypothetical protein [Armatimonadota bacterium]
MKRTKGTEVRRSAAGFGLSLAATVFLSSLLVILKETTPWINGWMKAATGHHWITHAAIVLVSYALLGLLFSKTGIARRLSARTLLFALAASLSVSCAAILAFYLLHA